MQLVMPALAGALMFVLTGSVWAQDNCSPADGWQNVVETAALESAQGAPPPDSCVLQEWSAAAGTPDIGDGRIDTTVGVTAYERFLACYRSAEGHGAVGELGVETEKRRIAAGTRFVADVTCSAKLDCADGTVSAPSCAPTWGETDCCYDMDHAKY